MTKAEKHQFIADLVKSVTEDIHNAIDADKVPEDWDGHELRQLLADKFGEQTTKLHRSRQRAYQNTLVVNNI